mmetsp:Transcript_45320/g.71065  ORF Transcript_45320/g.71065 Transcript_45320/m.71065 type:complete len:140 (+) Transcript_45320:3-422(+)
MKPLHNMLKVLWASGVLGSVAVLAATPSHTLALSLYQDTTTLLASGWVFVALTGVFFKEFACFQRWEASALFALVPVVSGGHFLHLIPEGIEPTLLVALSSVFVFFALRKFTQPFHADIGDKTVFEYLALQEKAEAAEP